MNVLAIDTSTKVCSGAIAKDDNVIYEDHNLSEKEHSQTLMPMVKKSFETTGLKLDDMNLLSCAVGPGSFTGIRIGIATIKAFSDAKNIPVVGINSLEALAYTVVMKKGYEDCKILSLINAKNDYAYFAVYRIHNKNFSVYKNPDVMSISDVIEFLNFQEKVYIIGDIDMSKIETLIDAKISKEMAQGRQIAEHEYIDLDESLSKEVCLAAINKYNRKIFGDSSTISPMYLRKPQAERQRLGLNDERIYILPRTEKDVEEIATNYSKFPNLWDINTFLDDLKNSKYYVAKQNNEIVGFVSFNDVIDEVEINNIVTKEDKRNQGIASNLLSYIIRKGKANKINLEVNANNITARNLYRKFGFREVGERKNYYGGKDTAILMSL